MENTTKKIYADASGIVTFVCQYCGDVQKEHAEKYKKITDPIKIQCNCGKFYEVQIEFRKFYRKEIKLEGIYSTAANPKAWGKIVIRNISLEGCGFETMAANLLKPGEEIKIEFTLDDLKKSQIRKKTIVLSVHQHYIGCKFHELPGAYDPDLGFYLRKT